MNIVHIEDFFTPTAGYQINILAKYMSINGHSVTIITAEMKKIPAYLRDFFHQKSIADDDKEYEDRTGVHIIRLPVRAYISGRVIFGSALSHTLNQIRPDIVFAHGNDTVSAIWQIVNMKHLPYALISDTHMAEMASMNHFRSVFRWWYRHFITPIIIKNKLVVIRTGPSDFVSKCLGIPNNQCPVIDFGSDTLLFHPDAKVRLDFRKKYKIALDTFIVLYAGKLDSIKAGKLLAEAFLKKFICTREIILVVIGNSIGEYGKEVDRLFAQSENRIIRFPTQRYENLAQFYQAADIAVFPKQCSLSYFDVQACGLPVVAEHNVTNDQRYNHNNGFLFEPGDVSGFRDKIIMFANMDKEKFQEMATSSREYIVQNYNYQDIFKQYMSILENELQRQKSRIVNEH